MLVQDCVWFSSGQVCSLPGILSTLLLLHRNSFSLQPWRHENVLISCVKCYLNLSLGFTSVTCIKGDLSSSLCCFMKRHLPVAWTWYSCPFQRHSYWKNIKPVSWLFTHHRAFTPQAPFWCHALTRTRQEAGVSCDWTVILATQRVIGAATPVLFLPHTPSHHAMENSYNFIHEH